MSTMEKVSVMEPPAPTALMVPTPPDLLARAFEQNVPPDLLAKYMDLYERWQQAQALKAFNAALAEAKAEMPVITKNRAVAFDARRNDGKVGYRYEDLAEIARAITPVLGKHGLSYRFRTSSKVGEPISVTCIISHRDGYSEENTLTAGRDDTGAKNAIQAIGSTVSYLQKYTLKAALGLAASDDDDGRAFGNGNGNGQRLISEEQALALNDLVESVGASRAKLLKLLKVENLESVPASRFDEVVAQLKRYGEKKAAVPHE